VFRFWTLIALRSGGDSPTEEMLRDVPFVLNLVAWTVEVVVLLYGGIA
jgi:decaprenyl-phosphate phosphoribosyltransferase